MDTIGLTGIDLIAIDQQGGGGIRGQSADPAIRCDTVYTAGGGCQQSVRTRTQSPTDIFDVGNTLILPGVNHVKSVGITNVDLSVKGCDGMNPARQSVLRQEITIYRRQFDGEDTITRSTPEHTVTVVGHVRHLVGTKAVGFGDGIEFTSLAIAHMIRPCFFSLLPEAHRPGSTVWVVSFKKTSSADVFRASKDTMSDSTPEVRLALVCFFSFKVGMRLSLLIDIIVADHKLHRLSLLEDLHHLAFECVFPVDLLQVQFAVVIFLQTGKEIVATHPDGVLAVAIDHCDTS